MNCLVKQIAMSLVVVAILLLNTMEMFSVCGGALLDGPCMVFQRVCVLCLWSQWASRCSFHIFVCVFVCRKLSPHLGIWELDHRCLLFLCCFFVWCCILCPRVRACNCYESCPLVGCACLPSALTNCKSCRTQHWELPQDVHKTQNIHLHDKTLTVPIHEHLQLHASQYKQKTQHPSHPLHKHTTYFNTPRLKNTIFNNGRYTTNIPTDPHTVTTTDTKTNMHHIHTSIVLRHLATRGNNKILCTPSPHISSSKERLPRPTRHTIAQLGTNKSPFLKSYLHKVDAKTHSSPLCPLCNINTHDTHYLFNWTHIPTTLSPLDLWTDQLEWLHCWPDGRRSWLVDHKREHQTPPTSKGHGSG